MSGKNSKSAQRLDELFEGGDYRSARAEALRVLADPKASDVDRAAAAQGLLRTRPEPLALIAGAAGFLVLVAVFLFGLFHHA